MDEWPELKAAISARKEEERLIRDQQEARAAAEAQKQAQVTCAALKLFDSWDQIIKSLLARVAEATWPDGKFELAGAQRIWPISGRWRSYMRQGFEEHIASGWDSPYKYSYGEERPLWWWAVVKQEGSFVGEHYAVILMGDEETATGKYFEIDARLAEGERLKVPLSVDGLKKALVQATRRGPRTWDYTPRLDMSR